MQLGPRPPSYPVAMLTSFVASMLASMALPELESGAVMVASLPDLAPLLSGLASAARFSPSLGLGASEAVLPSVAPLAPSAETPPPSSAARFPASLGLVASEAVLPSVAAPLPSSAETPPSSSVLPSSPRCCCAGISPLTQPPSPDPPKPAVTADKRVIRGSKFIRLLFGCFSLVPSLPSPSNSDATAVGRHPRRDPLEASARLVIGRDHDEHRSREEHAAADAGNRPPKLDLALGVVEVDTGLEVLRRVGGRRGIRRAILGVIGVIDAGDRDDGTCGAPDQANDRHDIAPRSHRVGGDLTVGNADHGNARRDGRGGRRRCGWSDGRRWHHGGLRRWARYRLVRLCSGLGRRHGVEPKLKLDSGHGFY